MNLPTTISMKRSRRELSIDMAIHVGNQITPSPSFTFMPQTGVSFYSNKFAVSQFAFKVTDEWRLVPRSIVAPRELGENPS